MKVVEGLRNNIKLENKELPEDQIDEILRRRLICNECPLNSIKAKTSQEYKELMKTPFSTKRKELFCSICYCVIDYKTASLSSNCGLEVYNSENPQNVQPLKWKKYE